MSHGNTFGFPGAAKTSREGKSYRDIRRLRRITAKLSQSHEWQGLGIDKRNLGKI